MKRKYLPTVSELIDRLSICQLKAIYIYSNKDEYEKEIESIMYDINLCLKNKKILDISKFIRAVQINMLANRVVWENESKARQGGKEQDKLLKFTHSINGIRNNAKNIISQQLNERKDLKLDCLASEFILDKSNGDWDIW